MDIDYSTKNLTSLSVARIKIKEVDFTVIPHFFQVWVGDKWITVQTIPGLSPTSATANFLNQRGLKKFQANCSRGNEHF